MAYWQLIDLSNMNSLLTVKMAYWHGIDPYLS